MRHVRNLIALFFLLLPFVFHAKTADERPRVVATASMIADMAQVIAGDLLEVQCIVPIGSDPHLHEPTPGDARMVSDADLILVNGLSFEGWLGKLIANSGTVAIVDTVTRGIDPIRSDRYTNAVDPHAWMDAVNGQVYIRNITEALVRLDPANEDVYRFNYEAYRQQLKELDAYIHREIARIPVERRVLVTSHDAFRYYGVRYGLRLESLLGTSTDADIQTADVMRISRVIDSSGIPAIFAETTVNPKVLEQLARDHGVGIGGKLYSDSIGDKYSDAPGYLEMLKYNTDMIVAALTGEFELRKLSNSRSFYFFLVLPAAAITIILFLIYFVKSGRS